MPPKAPTKSRTPKASAEPPEGCAFVRHPDGGGCSYRGIDLAPDADGKLLVPVAAVAELEAHGFAPISAA